jgi:NAD(P)-dependent dehydrogenase (short-subunit alcohol dehydrogenase family)
VSWTAPRLDDAVAVVTGATRGVGKGIALALGDTGATVYVVGRSTVDEAAAAVTARGGRGIAARADLADDAQVEALFARIREESGRLDLVVANAWGGYEGGSHDTFGAPFWQEPLSGWASMFDAGLRLQFMTARFAAPLLLEQGSGLVVLTGGWDDPGYYLGNVLYDLSKTGTVRLVKVLAHELRSHGVAVVGVYPGFTRTEAVIEAFAAEGREPPEETHSPEFVGRAVAHVFADPEVLSLSGTGAQAATCAERYGFRDVDGRTIAPFVLPDEYRLQPAPTTPDTGRPLL